MLVSKAVILNFLIDNHYVFGLMREMSHHM